MKLKLVIPFLLILASCEKNRDDNEVFLKFFGDAREDIGYSVASVEGGYIIAGQLTELVLTAGNYIYEDKSVKKFGILKTGVDGNLLWKRTFPLRQTGAALKVLGLADGSVIAAGWVTDTVNLQKDILVVRLNTDGSGTLQKIFKFPGNQTAYDIIETSEGFLLLGTTDVERLPITQSTGNGAGKKDILLFRMNRNLDFISSVALGFPGNDEGIAIKKDSEGGYIIAGTTDRSEPGQAGQAGNNIFLLKINSDGNTTQPAIIGGPDDEYAADIEVLSDGYIVSGSVGNETSEQKIFIARTSKNIYEPPFITKIDISLSSSQITSFAVRAMSRYQKNSFVLAGQAGSGSSAKQLIIVVDDYGNVVSDRIRIMGSNGVQIAYDVLAETNNDIVAVGKNSFEKNSMISLLKFSF